MQPVGGTPVDYPLHPLVEWFPELPNAEYRGLVASLRQNGLRYAIVLHDGKVLDGRHRLQACRDAGVEPRFTEYKGDDPVGFVLDTNLHRRHLTASQRQLLAARVANATVGAPEGNLHAAKNKCLEKSISLPTTTQRQAAKRFNVGRSGVQKARSVLENSSPSVVQAVTEGAVTVNDAVTVSRLEHEEQDKLLAAVRNGESRTLAQAAASEPMPREQAQRYVNGKAEWDKRNLDYVHAMSRIEDFHRATDLHLDPVDVVNRLDAEQLHDQQATSDKCGELITYLKTFKEALDARL